MTIGQADEDGLPPSMLNRVGYLLYRVGAEATARADAELRKMDLTARQVGILTLVIERRPMSQRELGAKLGVDRTTMVGLLDKLEEHGLVERRRSPEDRRVFLIQPTARGERIHRRAITSSPGVRSDVPEAAQRGRTPPHRGATASDRAELH